MNNDLINLVMSYLIQCYDCNKYNILINHTICSLCKRSYCKKCKESLHEIYGFYKSNYCIECENFL